MPVSSVTEHWIKQDAIIINLNHFGDPDYLQVSVLAGAVVMAFKQDVIGYNAARNYRTWPLQAANTFFETTDALNVYARLTRSEVNASALIIYDPVLRDIEGRSISYADDGSEILGEADAEYYYIYLGQISSSIDSDGNEVDRHWSVDFRFGNLDTNQYRNEEAGGEWMKMFRLNKVTDMIDVLKTFSSAFFKKIFIGNKGVTDIKRSSDTDKDVPVSDESLPTSRYLQESTEKKFLRKDKSDRTSYLQKFLGGIEVGEFLKGSNGIGMYQDSTGNWHIETDYLDVRFKLSATEVEIQKTSHIGGKVINTAASMVSTNVIETSSGYICYMNTTDDAGNTIYNTFEVGDQAYCETFNLDKQANGKVGNHFFWRLVTEVGSNYIVLSKSDCAEQSDAPLAGDEIVLLGNRTNAERQGAIVQASAGSGSPYIRIYDKIKSYTLPKPKINLSPEGTEISADSIVLQSTGNNMEDEVGSLINITNTLSRELDGSFYVWQGEDNTIPTLENEPAVNWITDDIKQEHVDDFYITTDGFCYQFAYDEATNTYSWKIVTDQYLIKFVEQIGEKRRVFVDMPTDNDVYDVGDTWVNATYADEELGIDYSNDVLVCIQAKDKGEAFNIVHWRKSSKYTDDTVANLVKKELKNFSDDYKQTIPLLQRQIDSKAETWYQDSDPKDGEGWGEDAKHVGDLWYKESTGETFYFDGTKWNKQNIPVAVFDKFDAKASIFVSKPSAYKKNDMWILESAYTLKGGAKYNKGTIVFANTDSDSFDAGHWEKYDSYTDDSSLNNFIKKQYTPFANNISKQIDKKAETWYQDADPRTSSSWGNDEERIGDMWCTTEGKTQIWNGTKWMQQGIPDDVFDTIDGKSSIFVEKPEHGYKARDMWILEEDYILRDSYSKGTIVIAIHDMIDDIFVDSDWVRFDSYASGKEVVNIKDDLQSLANKVNSEFAGSFYIWQGDDNTIPTLNNKPAVDWTDDNMRQAHVDDFYISADGVVYQFRNTNGVFSWVTVDDKYIIAYIEQMRSQLLATGIDINGREIIATANKFTVRSDVDGTPIAVFGVEVVDGVGVPYIKGDLLRVNHVNIADKAVINKEGEAWFTDAHIKGEVNADSGEIGGFTIEDSRLWTTQGKGKIIIELGTNKGVFINESTEAPLFVARNDSGTIMRLYSQGNDAKALELVCNSQGNGTALQSVGNSQLAGRYAGTSTPHEFVNIAGLALSARRGLNFHATSSDEIYSWTDFLVADGDITLPSAKNCKGKILFVKANGNIICPESNGGLIVADGTSPQWARNGNHHSLIYISDGNSWYEFYCG